ncbi:Hypothetical predicted protein [Octopus vulgaris]|uniref:Uncharacterized protein n=1 Tax=Octopus vulgaris TaxID=6645 RepID=A0AA36FDH6_OCTVU|nr:Hypothetical predicted protein [Octopus vulgaris]
MLDTSEKNNFTVQKNMKSFLDQSCKRGLKKINNRFWQYCDDEEKLENKWSEENGRKTATKTEMKVKC